MASSEGGVRCDLLSDFLSKSEKKNAGGDSLEGDDIVVPVSDCVSCL
jgi:hypothetical protein